MSLLFLPTGLTWYQMLDVQMWLHPMQFGQAHAGVAALTVLGMSLMAGVLWFMPRYSRSVAYVALLLSILSFVIAFTFAFRVPGIWALCCFSSWRLTRG
ncbi:hypothetical protein RF679_02345 [Undibacterium cyanobacteriorum]|uniref:Uncharacterized protein n=1 Tax=Undibacterium cyanobacteriorum TaxID=3073561 RepID=A0ABY9RKD9_9BURK|nr:hypothetical protein [Undibacterium sp. 20NA77.5]WMW81135.1 hypothetical protein RF679_02345 [Undibacterium sp. 20NA77.5]